MIHAKMSLLEIVEKYPDIEEVLRSYDALANSCVLCEHLFDTLDDLAQLCSVKVENIVKNLNLSIIADSPENMERMTRS